MNRERSNNFTEMRDSFRGQRLPEWFRNMMSGRRSSSTYDMRPFETQSMMSSIRMEDPGNFMTQFMRTERGYRATQGSHNYTYDEKKEESTSSIPRYESFNDQQSNGHFPFYRFGNWSPSFNI
ncbi:unnamed protein product [Lepeophtheirus salmonis]|uniref:(salmon louse) hypothetical protein n=1 Tax=Lepeophtheirus salmonis TaxID=72036 RepID=A0A7R8H2D0_LEPSM|nr:unnamed protein product [Lepeophtheirus salmonis]CAF2822758.1 unnamed protein product [Lepeophtheirus salmonis]